jgi:thiol-disulfide isomerase/thioredoxin
VITGEAPDDGDILVRIDATGSPALRLTDGDDRTVTLGDGGDTVIMVNFWATWCAPCVKEIASLVRLGDHFDGQPLRVLAVNIGETPEQVTAFFQRRDIEPNFAVLYDRDGQAARDWRVYAIPSTYLLDRDRAIRYGYRGALRWDHPEVIGIVQRLIDTPAAGVRD